MFSGVGGSEVLLVIFVVLILFGSKRIPGLARTMGKVVREVRKTVSQIHDELDKAAPLEPPKNDPPRAG